MMSIEERAREFVAHARATVAAFRWGTREGRLALVGLVLLAVTSALATPVARELPIADAVRTVITYASLAGGGLCLMLALYRIVRRLAPPPDHKDKRAAPPALKGAASFGPQDASLFARLGRDDELHQIRSWIIDDQKPLVAVMGDSGAGKTSLLRAGLAHALALDKIPVLYWEALSSKPEAGLLHSVQAQWGEGATPPDAETLTSAVAARRVVVVLDQLEQLVPERHPKFFEVLRQVLTSPPPYRATWIVAFRPEYAAAWTEFTLTLPAPDRHRIEILPLKLFKVPAARRVLAILADEAGLAVDHSVIADLAQSLSVDGLVSPVDVGISLLGLGELAGGVDPPPFTAGDFRSGNGPAGLLTRYLERGLSGFQPTLRQELLLALLALVDRERDQRHAEGRSLAELGAAARTTAPSQLAEALARLAASNTRVLEALPSTPTEPRYRLLHERFIPPLLVLCGAQLAEATQAGLLLDRAFRIWAPGRQGRYLLTGRDLRQVLRHQGQFPWGEAAAAKRDFLARSQRQRARGRTLLAATMLLGVGLSWLAILESEQQLRETRLIAVGLPKDLAERAGQLESLELQILRSTLSGGGRAAYDATNRTQRLCRLLGKVAPKPEDVCLRQVRVYRSSPLAAFRPSFA